MTINLHAVAVWVGIAGSAAGIGFPAYSTHKQDQADIAMQQQMEIQRAVKEQAEHDRLWRTLDAYNRHLELLDENLPDQERRIARLMFAQMQAQQEAASNAQYDKSSPVMAQHGVQARPAVAADAPSEEKPQ